MLTQTERLARQKAQPALVVLHRALSRLTSVITVMNTGAHPDDEHNGMLAVMRLAWGMRVVIACSTRGEGGQNSLGPERTGALGIVRSRELEEAAKIIDADIAWLGHGPNDPVHDFGFSKNGPDTLARWGKELTIDRLVRAYRTVRPDIVIPTFLDVPGQHGHHRAMTEAAETAIALAADPDYITEGLSPWQVAKYYLPAWSGGGDTYDDEVPPPPATVTITAPGRDGATGAAFSQIGEWSRAYHASQGMGFWRDTPQTEWQLHLKAGGDGAEDDIRFGLPDGVAELADGVGETAANALAEAETQIDAALVAFPHRETIVEALVRAAAWIDVALEVLDDEERDLIGHRLERKLVEIDAALMIASGVTGQAWAEPDFVAPGGTSVLHVRLEDGASVAPVTIIPVVREDLSVFTPEIVDGVARYTVSAAADAELSDQYAPDFSSLGGNGDVSVLLEATIGGRVVRTRLDLDETLQIAPANSVELLPDAIIVPLASTKLVFEVGARIGGPDGALTLDAPDGWSVETTEIGLRVTVPGALGAGLYSLPAMIDGQAAFRQTPISYPHIGRTRFIAPQMLNVLALDLVLPEGAKVGYIGGGSDRVGLWLARMGVDVTELDAAALQGDLSGYTTLVVGIFAFGLRPELKALAGKLRAWVEAGGHLVTLYHRPADGWTPETTPPRRIKIGSPSLRWRVTNPEAKVDVLVPDHVLLVGPNAISVADWAGWNKERGLYFAAEWDDAYEPLLAIHDAGEQPLKGALISGRIGLGRHTHTSLVLHHQLDRLVPGAFRLLANLVQPAR